MENTKCRTIWRWFSVAAYAALLFYLSSLPQKSIRWIRISDKISHALIYVGFSFVLLWAFDPFRKHWSRARMFFVAVLGSVIYGIFDELHQHFIISRNSDWRDIIADTIGGALGGLLYILIKRHVERNKNQTLANRSSLETP